MSNSEKHPEAWDFFISHARNVENENLQDKYRIPSPDMSGNFIYAPDPAKLWVRFMLKWSEPNINSANPLMRVKYIAEYL